MIPDLELIAHVLCPYVQRSVIVLQEKRIPYRRTDINLANKPEWFSRISPLGRVPVLVVDQQKSLFESSVICEFLNEITPNSLHPGDPFERANHRAWIEFGSGILNGIAQLYSASSFEDFELARKSLRYRFTTLEERLGSGPFFSGPHFQMIDAVYAPIFRYFDVFERFLELEVFIGLEKIQAWRAKLRDRDSVQRGVQYDYPERLVDFIVKRGSYMSFMISEAVEALR